MIPIFSVIFGLSLLPAFGGINQTVVEETLYFDFQELIQSPIKLKTKPKSGFTPYEQSLYVDALWDLAEENSPEALKALNQETPFYYDLIQKLRLGILRIKHKRASELTQELSGEITNALLTPSVDIKIIYLIAAYEKELSTAGHNDLIALAKEHRQYFDISQDQEKVNDITQDEVEDLFNQTPDITTYMNGEYIKSVKLFMFCRSNRLYPCLMVMKDVHGEEVRDEQGVLWTHKALGSSSKGLPSYSRNGNTPAGIHTIDSVMPSADQPISFGKFRRMILNFIPKSKNEVLMKSLLPASSQVSDWWKPTTVARDIGRNLLRIHGTGKINTDKNTPYYPFMRTSGCIASRENTYDGVTFTDQRELLDMMMKAMDLAPSFENETSIKGILYLVEIDDLNEPVTLNDLALRGIE
jgi:hypothetical protein